MREEELIEEGFERVDVLVEESGDQSDYYYYTLNLEPALDLTSNASDEAGEKNWVVYCYDLEICIRDIEDIQTLILLYKKWGKNKM